MRKLYLIFVVLMVLLIVLPSTCVSEPAEGGNLEIITSITISGFMAVGVELAWNFTKSMGVKFGLSAGVDLYEELSPLLWTRALFQHKHKLSQESRFTFYGGEGIDCVFAFTEVNIQTLIFAGVSGGVEYSLLPNFSLIGEGRWGVPLLGERFNAIIVPLGVTVGGALVI